MSDERKRAAADVLARCSEEERTRLMREAFARLGGGRPLGPWSGPRLTPYEHETTAQASERIHAEGGWCTQGCCR